jgi:membrane-associated protease RseP (regulator of RpoE activity)
MQEFAPPSDRVEPTHVEALREAISDLFSLTDTTLDYPEPGHVRFRGRFMCELPACYDDLRIRFEQIGFTPMIRREKGGLALIAMPIVFNPPRSNPWINLVLFILTIFTTLYVGAMMDPAYEWPEIWRGWPFSLSMLLILGAHELGHYFAARAHNVPVTLPYFIPIPTIIGTMGAFIRLKAPVSNRRALLDVGAAGPLAGLVFALPILFIGLATSTVGPLPASGYTMEGNSLLYALAKIIVFGRFLPSAGTDVLLNQVAWAGWAGLFVTGLNLIPVGQLDGGHVAYTLFGDRARQLYWPFIIGLVLIAALTLTISWVLWIVLLIAFGRVYAQPLDDVTPLDPRRRVIAIITLCLFVLVFVPIPLQVVLP